ncbi:probable 28S ribosomal protein S6, mitochondrial [Oppia nitens]|uniref:probable 28S ribosomal protein S6, mitochondrial n=1 Tax=Oppia nitens TaxID=1686743 RepID=UPI0023DB1720|nr:probable 28S ribosomal protein S6, mitochondrial [Oppia nitens]
MPGFELIFITRRLNRTDLKSCLKRTGELILNSNGILRKIENLGTRGLPHKISSKIPGQKAQTTGNYFVYHLDVPPLLINEIHKSVRMDTDIMKVHFTEKTNKVADDYVCTLDDEHKPPMLRPSVQSLFRQNEERLRKSKKVISRDNE